MSDAPRRPPLYPGRAPFASSSDESMEPPPAPTDNTSPSLGLNRSLHRAASANMNVAGDVNSGTYTRVHLRVKAEARFGENVHCSGSSLIMGQFNPCDSMTLVTTPDEYPYWTTIKPLILPRGVPHQYMYALFSGGVFSTWEPIESERVLVPEGREMTVVEEYGVYDPEALLVATDDISIERGVVYERKRPVCECDDDRDDVDAPVEAAMNQPGNSAFRQRKLKSRYKRYVPSSYHPDPLTTLFLACYHLPVKLFKSTEGVWRTEWNRDSLISRSKGSVADFMKVAWIGCVTYHCYEDVDNLTEEDKKTIEALLLKMNCHPVFLDPEVAYDHYQGYCKSKLWPMFHNVDILDIYASVWDRGEVVEWKEERTNGRWWQAYKKVNRLISTRVGELCGNKDTVWVHDYHLLLVPSYLTEYCKAKGQNKPTMVFFLHVPFPTSEIFRELSHGPQLLQGVLGVDVVGFHSFEHARHFLNACKRFLGLSYQSRRGGNLGVDYGGRNVVITISHVGVETAKILKALEDPEVYEEAKKIREKHKGKIIACSVDVCQRLSGISLRLLAFEQFFSMCPSWKDKLVLVQKAQITNARIGDQQKSHEEIATLIDRISAQHGSDWIDYEETTRSPNLKQRLALWLASDILMVMSVREGLNLKPLEYVYTKSRDHDSRPGVVVLSEFSVCCCVLNGAIRVNPWHISAVVNALDHALTMTDDERLGRRARDLPYITSNPPANWTRQVLSVLQEATDEDEEDEYTDLEYMDTEIGHSHLLRIGDRSDFKQLKISKVLEAFKNSKRRVFLLDYGGTIIARENMAMYVKKDFTAVTGKVPTPRMLEALTNLCDDPRNTVFVVSGVSQANLTHAVGHICGLGLAAENGALYSWAGTVRSKSMDDAAGQPHDNTVDRHWHHHNFKFDWKPVREVVDPILKVYCTRTNGSMIKYSDQAIGWNFRSTDPEWGMLQANSLQSDLEEVLRDLPVHVIRKKGLLEIVPEGLNKGVVALQILTQDAQIHRGGNPDFLFCIGDDTTDESMFKAIFDYYAERSDESLHGNRSGGYIPGSGNTSTATGSSTETPPSSEGSLLHVFTCTVGKRASHAHLYVNSVDDVEDLLAALGEATSAEVSMSTAD